MSDILFEQNPKLNIIKSPEKDTDWIYSKIVKSIQNIPEAYSLEKYLPPVKNQGKTGFCHSYSAASMKEAQEYKETGYMQIMSALHLAKHIKSVDGFTDTEGTTMINVCKTLYETGSILESEYPSDKYVAGSFIFPELKNEDELVHYKVSNYARCNNVDEIKQAIANNKFVLLGIQCLKSIYGVYSDIEVPSLPFDPNGKLIIIGGHQILVYAYDKDYIYFLNSWDEDWGFKGKAKLPIDYLTFSPKDMKFSFFIDAYTFVDLENDKLKGNKIELTIDNDTVFIDGKPCMIDAAPYIDKASGRCLVPVRFISEVLGYSVSWNEKTKKITIENGIDRVHLWANTDYAIVNGYKKNLDQKPIIKNDRTFVPIRFIGETLGCSVLWDNVNRKITILKP